MLLLSSGKTIDLDRMEIVTEQTKSTGGKWVTLKGGRRVLIKPRQKLKDAINESALAKLDPDNEKDMLKIEEYRELAYDNDKDLNAANKKFDNWIGHWDAGIEDEAKQVKKGEGLLAAEYKHTQAFFKAKGIKEVTMYRGITGKISQDIKEQLKTSKKITFQKDWAHSFSSNREVGYSFAGGNKSAFFGIVIKRKVPVENILTGWQTNYNFWRGGEQEYIVMDPSNFDISGKDILTR